MTARWKEATQREKNEVRETEQTPRSGGFNQSYDRDSHTILLGDGDLDGVKFLVIVRVGDLEMGVRVGVRDLGGDLDGVLDLGGDLELVMDFERDLDDVSDLVGVAEAVIVGLWLGLGSTIGDGCGAFTLTILPLPSSPYSP